MSAANVLSQPAIAVILGAIVGMVLVAPLLWATRFATAEKADFAPIATLVASMGGLLLGVGLLFGYNFVAENGFLWFGPSMIVGFMIGLGVIAVAIVHRVSRSDDEKRS